MKISENLKWELQHKVYKLIVYEHKASGYDDRKLKLHLLYRPGHGNRNGKKKVRLSNLVIKVEIWFMGKGLSSGNECIVEGIVHEIVERGSVEVGEGRQTTAEVGGTFLCSKHAAKSQVM